MLSERLFAIDEVAASPTLLLLENFTGFRVNYTGTVVKWKKGGTK